MKLVLMVRENIAKLSKVKIIVNLLLMVPGIGCPVIASITDTDLCLVVAEPTLSGLNDLEKDIRIN